MKSWSALALVLLIVAACAPKKEQADTTKRRTGPSSSEKLSTEAEQYFFDMVSAVGRLDLMTRPSTPDEALPENQNDPHYVLLKELRAAMKSSDCTSTGSPLAEDLVSTEMKSTKAGSQKADEIVTQNKSYILAGSNCPFSIKIGTIKKSIAEKGVFTVTYARQSAFEVKNPALQKKNGIRIVQIRPRSVVSVTKSLNVKTVSGGILHIVFDTFSSGMKHALVVESNYKITTNGNKQIWSGTHSIELSGPIAARLEKQGDANGNLTYTLNGERISEEYYNDYLSRLGPLFSGEISEAG